MPKIIDDLKRLTKRLKSTGASTGVANVAGNMDRKLVMLLSGKRLPSSKQLKHLHRFLTPKEKTAIRALGAIVAIMALAVGGKYYSDHVRLEPADGGTYSEAVIGMPRFLNPVLAGANDVDSDLDSLIFSGLMRVNPEGHVVPDLAAKYEISQDGKTYTFKLRQDVNWHDGTEFSARDVVATFGFIKDATWRSPYYSRFQNVSVEAVDDNTVKFTLAEPFAPFLSMLTIGILPDHLWQDIRPENAARADLNAKPIGTGPYRFKSLVKDKKGAVRAYQLIRNDDYYGTKPHLTAVTFKFYADAATAIDALVTKRVEGIGFLPQGSRTEASRQRAIRLYDLHLAQYTAVFLNPVHDASLKQKEVRQALAWAIDRDRLLREAAIGATPVYGPLLPGLVGFHADIAKHSLDRAKAAALLDQAGWKLDADGFRKKDGVDDKKQPVKTPLHVTLTTVDAPENQAVAQALKRDWEAIGVKTDIETKPASRIQKETIHDRAYDALLYGEIIGPDPDPYPFWHSSQIAAPGLNLAAFSSRRADELLEQGRRTTDDAVRAAAYRDFQNILADEVPAIFLYRPAYTYAVSREIMGIESGLIFSPADRFAGIADWYVNTKRVWK